MMFGLQEGGLHQTRAPVSSLKEEPLSSRSWIQPAIGVDQTPRWVRGGLPGEQAGQGRPAGGPGGSGPACQGTRRVRAGSEVTDRGPGKSTLSARVPPPESDFPAPADPFLAR